MGRIGNKKAETRNGENYQSFGKSPARNENVQVALVSDFLYWRDSHNYTDQSNILGLIKNGTIKHSWRIKHS